MSIGYSSVALALKVQMGATSDVSIVTSSESFGFPSPHFWFPLNLLVLSTSNSLHYAALQRLYKGDGSATKK